MGVLKTREPDAITVGVISSSRLHREGLIAGLRQHHELVVLDLLDGTERTLRRIRAHAPEVLLLDLPPESILGITRKIRRKAQCSAMVAISSFENDEEVIRMAAAGFLRAKRGELICSPRFACRLARRLVKLASRISVALVFLCGCSDSLPTKVQPPRVPNLPVLDWAYDMNRDGSRILYRHRDSTDALPGGVYLLDVSDTLRVKSMFPNDSVIATDCRFSPDGLKIAYTRNFLEDIFVRDLVTGEDTRVTFTYGNAVTPDWDPSGRYIVYSRVFHDYNTPDSTAGIHVVDTQTLTDTALRHSGEVVFGASPRWSPDSLSIICYTQHIVIVKIDGSSYKDLTPNDRRNNQYPVWIDDGRSILFESYAPTSFNIHETQVIRPDGSGRTKLPFDVRYVVGFAATALTTNLCAYTGTDSTGLYYVLLQRDLYDGAGTTIRQLTPSPPRSSVLAAEPLVRTRRAF